MTDGTGRYQIVNLVPGTYSVTCTLPGFNTMTREGVDSPGRSPQEILGPPTSQGLAL